MKDSSNTMYSSGSMSFKSAKCFVVSGHKVLPFIQVKGFGLDLENLFIQSGWVELHTTVPHSSISCLEKCLRTSELTQIPRTSNKKTIRDIPNPK